MTIIDKIVEGAGLHIMMAGKKVIWRHHTSRGQRIFVPPWPIPDMGQTKFYNNTAEISPASPPAKLLWPGWEL